jgi:type III pantothenate kinase
VENFTLEIYQNIIRDYREIKNAIISTVKDKPNELLKKMSEELETLVFLDHETKIPIENNYKTPESLGKDRLAAVIGANYLYYDRDILVIDAGTAITYDFITSEGKYSGGFITPGLSMRFKALHHFTSKLPLLNPYISGEKISGDDTNSSITGGIQLGLEGEINSNY